MLHSLMPGQNLFHKLRDWGSMGRILALLSENKTIILSTMFLFWSFLTLSFKLFPICCKWSPLSLGLSAKPLHTNYSLYFPKTSKKTLITVDTKPMNSLFKAINFSLCISQRIWKNSAGIETNKVTFFRKLKWPEKK